MIGSNQNVKKSVTQIIKSPLDIYDKSLKKFFKNYLPATLSKISDIGVCSKILTPFDVR